MRTDGTTSILYAVENALAAERAVLVPLRCMAVLVFKCMTGKLTGKSLRSEELNATLNRKWEISLSWRCQRMIDIAGVDAGAWTCSLGANPMIRQKVHYLGNRRITSWKCPREIEIAKLHLQRLQNLKEVAVATKEFRKLAGYYLCYATCF